MIISTAKIVIFLRIIALRDKKCDEKESSCHG
jgi:hypothetical protein